jgi:EAL domain-containing protein (putative c-di-GMP-specific phosphodiesterase class I)/DNA-binding NarL/FixJ family response regulator
MSGISAGIGIVSFGGGHAETIRRILTDEGYDVIDLRPGSLTIPQDSGIRSVLLLAGKSMPDEALLRETAGFIQENTMAEIIMVAQLSQPEDFLSALSSGIYHFISLPCEKSHFTGRIRALAGREPVEASTRPVDLNFSYREKNYSIKIPELSFVSAIISAMESFQHQNRLLISALKSGMRTKQPADENKAIIMEKRRKKDNAGTEKELFRALENNEFLLYYQPIISIADGRLAGFESLIRWRHPEKGIIPPDDFIPQAESSPVIIPLGFWIIEEAMRQMSAWKKLIPEGKKLRLTVNLSARQFTSGELSRRIMENAEKYDIDNSSIGFEITESAFMEDREMANTALLTLKAERFPLYLDDFGTGYSSLSYLLSFPVNVLKIDKSFVEWMHIDEQSSEIVRSVTALAHNMKMQVVAEGIESPEHFAIAREFGCDYGQGYLFSRPLPADEATAFLERYRGKPVL